MSVLSGHYDSLMPDGEALEVGLDDFYAVFGNDNTSFPYEMGDTCCPSGLGQVCDHNEGMRFEAVFIPVLYYLVLVVGLLGNGLLLGVLAQRRRSWSVTDTFILHLGVADCLLLVTLPFWAAQATQDQGWSFGTPLCKITGAMFTVPVCCLSEAARLAQNTARSLTTGLCKSANGYASFTLQINFYCGIFLLACISLDRYLSIVHAAQMFSRRMVWLVQVSCLAVWLFSLLLSIPDWIFLRAVYDTRRGKTECIHDYMAFKQSSSDWRLASRLLYHIVGFLLPSAVLLFCYSCILRRLQRGSQGLQKQRAVRVILALVVVFFLCWTPYNITLMVDTLLSNDTLKDTCESRTALDKAMIVTSSFGYLHCSLNPVLYAFVGVKFRRQLLDILGSLGCKLKGGVRLQSTASSRRSSIWSESGDTSHAIAI